MKSGDQTWQRKKKTIPRKATRQEPLLPRNNAKTEDEIEATLKRLIGGMLMEASFTLQFATFADAAVLSNLVTPKMEVLLSFALSEMVNHLMSTSDQLKTLISTYKDWQKIMPPDFDLFEAIEATDAAIAEVVTTFE